MAKITDYNTLKVGSFVLFKNKQEEAVMKVVSIKKSLFSSSVDVECKIGKLDALLVSSDFKNGYVHTTTVKKPYYKKLKP